MTLQEAKRILMCDADFSGCGEKAKRTADALCVAIEALEKQIPKKPNEKIDVQPVYGENGAYIDADMFINLHCPVCGEWVGMAENGCVDYCSNCGQAIDWSDEE